MQVYVYSCSPQKLLRDPHPWQVWFRRKQKASAVRFTITDLTELELADMAFSRCGSRLYALSRQGELHPAATRRASIRPDSDGRAFARVTAWLGRATSKKLHIYSMLTGLPLRGKVCASTLSKPLPSLKL